MIRPAAALAVALLSACAYTPPPIPLSASPADLEALTGEWFGEYHADRVGGRTGTILFRLEAGSDEARGDVLMHVEGRDAVDALPPQGDPWANVHRDRMLRVTFVRAEGGLIRGTLDPYPDPVCLCEIRTTFTGRVADGVIEGTYTSVHVTGGAATTGKWRVSRR